MDLTFLDTITNFFKNLFETPMGVIILFVAVILISLLIAAILEGRTRKKFKDHKSDD